MKILNIHGYMGSASNAAFQALSGITTDLVSPQLDYDSMSPEETLRFLESLIMTENPDRIVGTSYGGFYAAILCARHRIPTLLVNPCLMPFRTLPLLGKVCNVKDFLPLFGELAQIDPALTSTIIGGKDEVVDTHDFTRNLLGNERFTVIPEGIHSGSSLPLDRFFREML